MTSDRILPGDIYEDCDFHPVLCIESSVEDNVVCGISLIDGTMPRSCSFAHCDVQRLSLVEAVRLRKIWERLFTNDEYNDYQKVRAILLQNIHAEIIEAVLGVVRKNCHMPTQPDDDRLLKAVLAVREGKGIPIEVPTKFIIKHTLLLLERNGNIVFGVNDFFYYEADD